MSPSPAFARPRLPPTAPKSSTSRVRADVWYLLTPSMRVYSKQGTRSGRARGQRKRTTISACQKKVVAISTGNRLPPFLPERTRRAFNTIFFCVCSKHEPRTREIESRGPHLRGESRSSDPRDKNRKKRRVGFKPRPPSRPLSDAFQCFFLEHQRTPSSLSPSFFLGDLQDRKMTSDQSRLIGQENA